MLSFLFSECFHDDQLWLKNRIETCFPASDIFQEKVYRGFGNQFPVIVECRELDRKTLADQPVVTADRTPKSSGTSLPADCNSFMRTAAI